MFFWLSERQGNIPSFFQHYWNVTFERFQNILKQVKLLQYSTFKEC